MDPWILVAPRYCSRWAGLRAQSIRAGSLAVTVLATSLLSQGAAAQDRGQLLYETHCITCHTAQVHWRERRLASNWEGLRAQVKRWQSAASLNWTEQDIDDVARHLNQRYYRFREPASRLAGAAPSQ
jgi:mono/diheme cytochrome c family protein